MRKVVIVGQTNPIALSHGHHRCSAMFPKRMGGSAQKLVPRRNTSVQNARRPPNIIHFLADDVGYDDVGCYGAKGMATPNVDRAARAFELFFGAPAPPPDEALRGLLTTVRSDSA